MCIDSDRCRSALRALLPSFFFFLFLHFLLRRAACWSARWGSRGFALHWRSSAGWGGQARVVFREALESGEYRAVFAEMSVQNYDKIVLVIVIVAIDSISLVYATIAFVLTVAARSDRPTRPTQAFSAT